MKKKSVRQVLLFTIVGALIILTAEGFLDITQSDVGTVIAKEYKYDGNSDFGIFTIQLDTKKYPKTVDYDRMEYNAFQVGNRINIVYKVPIIRFWIKPYGVEHELIQ
ncbi:hypothetical protein [Bacillus horti]|uniref:Uncharacterized protein n=1 Tax=Caldalkalibacillus horti TaxID=77523 RepID=A0ABT9W118_9BACI|nr:hypothetical protein [Bacillus horti]MDQ0166944.1 hypothetical protein [Bacillus horti]